MFPLGTVLMPHALLPLHVFEPRYRFMMRRCLDGDREFGVVLIERGSEVGGGDVRFDVGTLARIVQATELPDGRFTVTVVGLQPLRVTRWLDDDPYPRAEVEPVAAVPDDPTAPDVQGPLVARLATVLQLWHRLDARIPDAVPALSEDPERAIYEVAAIAPIGPIDAQRVLAAADLASRASLLDAMLQDVADDLRAPHAIE
jgi:Lon protease-like protein